MRIELVFAQLRNGRLLVDPAIRPNWTSHDLHTLPRWIQERIAVLRLLDANTESPLGAWYSKSNYKPELDGAVQFVVAIVPQPGDPKWEK